MKIKNKEKILVCGDIHGNFNSLNVLINKQKPSMILACGDFGCWSKAAFWTLNPIKAHNTKIHLCDGNHEDFDFLNYCIAKNELEIQPNTFYQPRGSTITLPDGRVVLFIGGAWSIDWEWRTDGVDWFKQEELISQTDVDNIKVDKVDIVISHTAPHEFELGFSGEHTNDISRKYLSDILFKFQPKQWYFGHWHTYRKSTYIFQNGDKCRWTCMDMSNHSQWWEELENLEDLNYA